jgi:hypothetical protein
MEQSREEGERGGKQKEGESNLALSPSALTLHLDG